MEGELTATFVVHEEQRQPSGFYPTSATAIFLHFSSTVQKQLHSRDCTSFPGAASCARSESPMSTCPLGLLIGPKHRSARLRDQKPADVPHLVKSSPSFVARGPLAFHLPDLARATRSRNVDMMNNASSSRLPPIQSLGSREQRITRYQ